MKNMFTRLMALMLALLMIPFAGAEAPAIEEIGAALLKQQTAFDASSAALRDADEAVADLEARYERNENDAKVQDALIEAMILQEEAAEAFAAAQQALTDAQSEHLALLLLCEDGLEALELTHDGKYADLAITVTLDENMVIYDLAVLVDGDERDQAVGQNGFLYQFIGKALPLTIGNGKKDDIHPAEGAASTSEDLVNTLNDLVWVDETPAGPITDPQGIADHIFRHGELPDNFITKKEAQKLGWDSSYNYVGDVAPGKSIGGDRFGNYEGRLPDKKGRTWYEADCYYEGKKRNAHRILYSSDGLVYYTDDHYETFTQMFPSWE